MRNKKNVAPVLLTLLLCSILLFWWFQPNDSVYEQINKAVIEADADYSELLHVYVDRERTLAFYQTSKAELGVVLLEEKFRGCKVAEYINKNLMDTDQALSWQGSSASMWNLHLLSGVVNDPEITQVILISENNKVAQIITNGSRSFWYALTDERWNTPITIRATNKEGKILYEYGDTEFWNSR